MVLPQPALALVDAERYRLAERRAERCRIEALFVEPVAGLVHRRTERVEHVVAAEPRRQPDVGAGGGAERMRAAVDAAPREVEAHRRHHGAHERLLPRLVDRDAGERRVGRGAGREAFAQRHQPLAQRREQLAQVGGAHARFVDVGQRVPAALVVAAQAVGLLLL